ncbi:MAG: alpha/beta fold hydrolase [Pseudomonadota bacterium]
MHSVLLAFGVLCAYLVGCAPALADRRDVFLATPEGGQIAATLDRPDGQPAPVVLLLHGFGGDRHEMTVAGSEKGVFEHLAEALRKAGLASLRIDFRGVGESSGAFVDTTVGRQIEDAWLAVDWLAASDLVDGDRMAVLGWSQGGLVAAHLAANKPDLRSVTLWAPVISPARTAPRQLGARAYEVALASKPNRVITSYLPWGKEVRLRARFYQEAALYSSAGAIAHFPGPLHVVAARADTVIVPPVQSARSLLSAHRGPQNLTIVAADHVWNGLEGPDTLRVEVIPPTVSYILEGLAALN